MCLQAVLKSVQVLLLNMCNTLELSGLFVCLVGISQVFQCLGDRKNCWVAVCLGAISTQADTMIFPHIAVVSSQYAYYISREFFQYFAKTKIKSTTNMLFMYIFYIFIYIFYINLISNFQYAKLYFEQHKIAKPKS